MPTPRELPITPNRALPALAVLGAGLIDGSIALSASNAGYRVRCFDPDAQTQAAATLTGLPMAPSVDLAIADADVVVLAVPVDLLGQLTKQIAPSLRPGAALIDAGSVKVAPMRQMQDALAAAGRSDITVPC